MNYGTAEHAMLVTEGRPPEIRDGVQWLTFAHLPIALQPFAAPFYEAALAIIDAVPLDSPELKIALNDLTTAKDAAVRAGIRSQTGRAGSVPRPQEVVDPPQLQPAKVGAPMASAFLGCGAETPDGPCNLRAGHPVGPIYPGHHGHMAVVDPPRLNTVS